MMGEVAGRLDEGARGKASISIDGWIALNDELAAMVRAGLPLERGLRDAGREWGRGRIGRLVEELAGRLERGEDLAAALRSAAGRVPEAYVGVVEAGLRAGRLPVALEALSAYARGYAEMRRAIGLALIYPAIVFIAAWSLFVWSALSFLPEFSKGLASLDPELDGGPFAAMARIGETAIVWGPIGPAILLAALGLFAASGRSTAIDGGWTSAILRRLPWLGPVLRLSAASSFAEMLSLLVDHGVPLGQSLRLAAAAAGSRSIRRSSEALATRVESGGDPAGIDAELAAFPPLIRWTLATGRGREGMAGALRNAATTYRRRAIRRADVLRTFLPAAILIGLAAASTLVYAMIIFGPLTILVRRLSMD